MKTKDEFVDVYPFTFVHISLVANQYFVDIIRGVLLDIPNPVSDIYMLGEQIVSECLKHNNNHQAF
jgi:hypothetical protein